MAIGSHRNILVFYSRYPLDGAIDLGDLHGVDFERLVDFFARREAGSQYLTANKKWLFSLNSHRSLVIEFRHQPFVGSIELGDLSNDNCDALLDMFVKAQKI